MGYYTYYTLRIVGADESALKEIFDYLKEHEETYYTFVFDDEPCSSYYSSDEYRWYSHKSDMIVLATRFPTQTFILHGSGEEEYDVWDEEYHGNNDPIIRKKYPWFPH